VLGCHGCEDGVDRLPSLVHRAITPIGRHGVLAPAPDPRDGIYLRAIRGPAATAGFTSSRSFRQPGRSIVPEIRTVQRDDICANPIRTEPFGPPSCRCSAPPDRHAPEPSEDGVVLARAGQGTLFAQVYGYCGILHPFIHAFAAIVPAHGSRGDARAAVGPRVAPAACLVCP
jgi:hypothetical protein